MILSRIFWNAKIDTKLVVGLGNPGPGYASSLHNLGFMCVNHFARTYHIMFNKKQSKARVGLGEVAAQRVVVARPHTFMNESGQAVSRLVKRYKTDLEDLIVICDDLDLPLGKIRIRPSGGSGGHKGIESIINELGSQDFPRIRVGIGRPPEEGDPDRITDADIVTYLLSDLPPEVKGAITHVIPTVTKAVHCIITEGLTAAMNKYN